MDNDKRKKVYDVLTSQTGYKDSFEDFNKFMNDRSAREKVYGVLRDKTGYKDSFDDFDNFMSGTSQGMETASVVPQQRPSLHEQVDKSQIPVMEDLPWMKNTGGQNGMLSADNLGDRLEDAYKRGDFEPFRHREEDARIRNEYTPRQVVNEADIMENAKNRFALTERGQELGNEFASIRKQKTDRYLEEFKNSDEYKAIVSRKPETQEEADAVNNAINELFSQKYGARLEEEMKPYNDAYHNEVLSRYGTDIKAGLTELGKKSTSEQVAGLTEEVNALLEKEHEVLKQHGGSGNNAMNALMGSAQYNQATGERRKEIGALESARKLLENSQEIINEARKAGNTNFAAGLIRGVRDNFDADKWTFGLAEMADAKYLNNALEKSARGEILTPAEEKLLDASTINMATQAYFSSDLGRGYKAGSVTAESLPFMLEFLVNPISGSGNTIAKGVLKYGLKRFGSVASTKGARIAGRMIGDSAAALGMEGTTGIGRVAAGTLDRMNQNYETSFNDEGEVEVKKTGDMGIGEALARSGASTFLENQSEMIFNAFRGGGKAARKAISDAAPGMSEKTANRIIDFYNKVRNNKTLKSVSDKAQFHGLLEEYGEEVYNNMANVAIGEMSAEDAFDVDNNIDTFLGLAPTSLAFATLGIGGLVTENIQAKNRLRKFVENLNEEGREIFSELWDEIEKGHDNIAKAFVKKTLTDESLSAEEKRDRIFSVRDMINARNTEQEIGEADNETVVATEEVPIPAIDKVNVYRNFKRAEQKVAQLLPSISEETLNSITDVDKFAADNNLNDAQKAVVSDYVSAREPYNAYLSDTNARRDAAKTDARERASADVDKIINKDNGFVVQAKHKFMDNPVYITRGNLVFGEDGLLDNEQSSERVYYLDEKGELHPEDIDKFDSILSQNTKDELVAEAEAQADADFVAQEEESLASPDIPVPERGITVAIKGENYLIEGPDEDNPGNVLAYKLDANGEIDKQEDSSQVLSLSPDEYYSAKEAELWNNDEQTADVASPESVIPPQKKILPDGRLAVPTGADESEVSFDIIDENGNVVDSDAMPVADFSLLNDYLPETEEIATDIPVSEIRETGTGEVADAARGVNTSENQPRNESSPEAEESKVSEDVVEPVNAIPSDEKGNLLYHKVPVNVTIETLDKEELEPEEVDAFVRANKDASAKLLSVLQSKAPKMGTNIAKYKANKLVWQEKIADAQSQVDYWDAVSEGIAASRVQPGDKTAEDILAMTEPLDGHELAAQEIAKGKIALLYDDFKRETGFSDAEARKLFGMFNSREKGGLTIEEAGELLMQNDLEEGTNFFDPGDANAGRNAILDVLSSVRTRGDLINYIKNKRDAMAERERRAEEEYVQQQKEAWVQENFHFTADEYDAYMERLSTETPYEGIDANEIDTIFVEAERDYQEHLKTLEDEQGRTIDANEGINGLLSEEQAGDTAGNTEVQARGDAEGIGSEDAGNDATPQESTSAGEIADTTVDYTAGKHEDAFVAPSINSDENVLDYASRISREKKMHDVRQSVNTSPTEAQKEAGNYKKGHVKFDGYNITIENPKGSARSGTDANGQAWSVTMNNDYGYIRGTKAVDGDHIDIFLSDTPMEGNVFVVDQNKEDGTFDESKVMYGFSSSEDARTAYLSNYSSGWESRIGVITEVSKDEFKKWVNSSVRKTKPFADYRSVKSENAQIENQGEIASTVPSSQKSEPTLEIPVMTEEEYIASKGYGFLGIGDVALHKGKQRTGKQQDKIVESQAKKDEDYTNHREMLRKEYQDKLSKGELREPNTIEKLIKAANGNPDNESTQAARRSLQKRSIDWQNNNVRFRIVHHGSGTSFDKFSTEKIGTGEGNQSFGWGLYFTDKKDIAQYYVETIGAMPSYVLYKNGKPADMSDELSRIIYNYDGDVKKAIRGIKKNAKMWEKEGDKEFADELMKSVELLRQEDSNAWELKEEGNRHLYDVEIPDTGFLHWDRPLADGQKKQIIEQADKEGIKLSFYGDELSAERYFEKMGNGAEGSQIYKALERTIGSDKDASEFLNRAGFNGIEYIAARHSGKKNVDSNFVVFDENAVRIMDHLRYREQNEDSTEGENASGLTDVSVVISSFRKVVKNHPDIYQVATTEDADGLKERGLSDKTIFLIKEDMNRKGLTGAYYPKRKFMVVYSSNIHDDLELEKSLWHETVHYILATSDIKDKKRLLSSCLDYVKEKAPEVYEKAVYKYSEEEQPEEAVAYLTEYLLEKYGAEQLINSKFEGDSDIANLFTQLFNNLKDEKGREHNQLRHSDISEGTGETDGERQGTGESGSGTLEDAERARRDGEGTGRTGEKGLISELEKESVINFAKRVSETSDKKSSDGMREAYEKEKSELYARISTLEKKITKLKDQEDLRRAVTEFIRKEIDSRLVGYLDKKDLNSLLVQAQNAKSNKSLEKIVMNVKNVALNAQRRKMQRVIDKLLSLQVQDINGKNMSVAKNVDDSTRKIFSFLRGRVSNLALSGFEDEMKYLRRAIRDKRQEMARLNNLLETAKKETDKQSFKMQLASLTAEVEEFKSKLRSVQEESEAVKEHILNTGDMDIDAEMERLNEKMDNAAKGKDAWTQSDTERMAALNILQGVITNKKHDGEIEGIEVDKQKLILNNSDLYRKRIGKNETERKRLTEQINENHRRIVAYDRLMNDIRFTQVKQMEMTIEELNELISNGKNSLMRRLEEEMKRKRELVGGAIRSVEGKKIDIFDDKATKEQWFKKFFSAPLGSFEYMCKRVNTHTFGKDGFLYKHFIAGNDGVLKAYDAYIMGMKEFRDRLNEKCEEIFGHSFEKITSLSDKTVTESGVYIMQSEDEDVPGYGVRHQLPLTKGQAMYIYQVWKMNDGRTKLELQGFDEESVSQIINFIGPEYVKFADWVQDDFLKDLREKYNGKYLEIYNTSLADIDSYIPLKMRKEAVRQDSSLSEDGKKRKTLEEKAGSLINRTANTKPVDITYSGFDVLLEHGNQMEEWNAYARVRKDLDYVLSSITFRNQLNANVRGSYENFYEAAEVATKANHPDVAKYGDAILGKISKGIVGGNIAFRLNTALKQVLSAPAFLGYSQSPLYMSCLTKAFIKPYNNFHWCMKNIPSFYERVKSGTIGNEKLDEKGFSKLMDKYIEVGMIPNKLVDAITCSLGAKSIYDYKLSQLKKAGTAEEEAHNQALVEADIYYNATQQSSHPAFLSPMQMSRTFTDRMLTTYQNSNIGYARKVMAAFYDLTRSLKWKELKRNYTDMYIKEGLSEAEAESKAYRKLLNENRKNVLELALFGWGLNLLWNIGSQGLFGFFRADGDDDDDKWTNDLAFVMTSPMKGTPGGNLLESIAIGYGMNPFLVYDELDRFMKESSKAVDEYGLISPEIAYITLTKASRYASVDLEVWGNIYLGVEGMARDGALSDDKLIDLMYILNAPKSSRTTVAREVYKNEPILDYAEKIARAYKYIPKKNSWENWVPGVRTLTKRKENEIKKEAARMQMTPEKRKEADKDAKRKKHLRKMKELADDPEAWQKYREKHKEEIAP